MSKKRLTFKQIQKKTELLEKTRQVIKGHTRKQISKLWQGYRGKKYTIEYLPEYKKRRAVFIKTDNEKSLEKLRTQYFDRKEFKVAKLQFGTLKIEKKVHQKFSEQDYYKLKKGADLDKTIERVFLQKNPKYILLTLKIRLPDTDQVMFVSDTLNFTGFQNLQKLGVTAMEKIMEKLSFVTKYEGFELMSIHLRLIYATPEKTTGQQKHRKNKR